MPAEAAVDHEHADAGDTEEAQERVLKHLELQGLDVLHALRLDCLDGGPEEVQPELAPESGLVRRRAQHVRAELVGVPEPELEQEAGHEGLRIQSDDGEVESLVPAQLEAADGDVPGALERERE